MKKSAILAILAVMVLGFAGTASAIDVEGKGQILFQMNIMDNSDYLSAEHDGVREDDINFWFRARTQFRFIAHENLWAVLYTQYKTRIGTNGVNTDSVQGDDNALTVKQAYLQYRFPGTEILTTAGIAPVDLPGAAAANMVLAGTERGLFSVSSPITDQISVAAAFIRNNDLNQSDGGPGANVPNQKDEIDIFYAALPITIDGISATPYFAYGLVGEHSYASTPLGLRAPAGAAYTKNVSAWWAGTSFSFDMYDPIVFNADLVYGSVDADEDRNDRSGFGMDASLAYTGFEFVQPKLVFAYTTGEDDDTDNGSERLPTIENDFAFGTYYFGGSAFTSSDLDNANQQGFWTVGLSLEKITFFEKLTHDIHFLYIQGTNDKDLIKNGANAAAVNAGAAGIDANGNFLTTEDNAFEIDFNTNYQIYDELAAIVEFGYINMNLDEDTWENYPSALGAARAGENDPALKLAVGLEYKF